MVDRCPDRDWSSITDQRGMFWFSGLTLAQGKELVSRHVYMLPSNGRMSLCGLNDSNLLYFADTLTKVLSRSLVIQKSVTDFALEMEEENKEVIRQRIMG